MIIEKLILGPLQTNCYVVYDKETKEGFVVDPADNFGQIKTKIDSLSLKIKYIILTHAHCDHIGALDELARYSGAKVCIGRKDEKALNDSELNLCIMLGKGSPIVGADILLKCSDELMVGKLRLQIIETPGHTPGSISILCNNYLFSGDTLFFESVGRTDFPGGSAKELVNSIKDKLYTLPGNTIVYPGHGDHTTIEHEIKNNPFIW